MVARSRNGGMPHPAVVVVLAAQQAQLGRADDSLQSRVSAQLLEDVLDIPARGVDADLQLARDALDVSGGGHEREDLAFTPGELRKAALTLIALARAFPSEPEE